MLDKVAQYLGVEAEAALAVNGANLSRKMCPRFHRPAEGLSALTWSAHTIQGCIGDIYEAYTSLV